MLNIYLHHKLYIKLGPQTFPFFRSGENLFPDAAKVDALDSVIASLKPSSRSAS